MEISLDEKINKEMYRIEYLQFNGLMQEVMSEELSLDYIVQIKLNGKPSKEEKKHLISAEEWAKYAFEHNLFYTMCVYKKDEIFASLRVDYDYIRIDFIEKFEGKYIVPLILFYDCFDLYEYFHTDKVRYFENNNLFLSLIESKVFSKDKNIHTKINFSLNNKASVTLSETYPIEKEWKTVEKKIEVNTSHNFIRCPKRYDDFLYLLDYKNNIKSEYFDIEKLR